MSPDEQVEALRRELDADPSDVRRRSRFLSALVRAGQGARARALIRDGFLCPWSWHDFKETGQAGLRFCDDCEREVYLALSKEELAEHAAKGRCVTAGAEVVLSYADEQIARVQSGREPEAPPPCVVEHGLRTRTLPFTAIDPVLAARLMPVNLMRARKVFPFMDQESGGLLLAFAEPPSASDLQDIELVTGLADFEPVLVDRGALNHAIDLAAPDFDRDMIAGLMMEEI